MTLRTVSLWCLLVPCVAQLPGVTTPAAAPRGAAELRLNIATLHAAALTTPRTADDTADSPYLLISILGPRGNITTAHLPATGHLGIRLDEALGPRLLANLRLQPGDSVRLLVSVLEDPRVQASAEAEAATASTKALAQSAVARASLLSSALGPLTKQRAHWLGSVALLLTNENGSTYWRALECAATCKILRAPAGTPLAPDDATAMTGVAELSGAGGTYHLQLEGRRTS